MVRSDKAARPCGAADKAKRSETAPASAVKRAQVAERDAKFVEYIKRDDVQSKMNTMKPSKRMGYLIKSFKEESGITIPTTMAYRAWHKSCGAIKTNKNETIKFPSDSESEDNQPDVPDASTNTISEDPADITSGAGDKVTII